MNNITSLNFYSGEVTITGKIVVVVGPSNSGKSRLLKEMKDWLSQNEPTQKQKPIVVVSRPKSTNYAGNPNEFFQQLCSWSTPATRLGLLSPNSQQNACSGLVEKKEMINKYAKQVFQNSCLYLSETNLHWGDENNPSEQPSLHEQGGGVTTVLGLLASMLNTRKPIQLIDEPHNQVHSAEARKFGRILRTLMDEMKIEQIFCTAFDLNFLLGLIDGCQGNDLQIIRLDRNQEQKTVAKSIDIPLTIFQNPFFRETGILQSLFHKTTVLCESDTDCRFYRLALDKMGCNEDIHFVPTFTQTRMKDIAPVLRKHGIDCKVIADMDMLTSGLIPLLETLLDGEELKLVKTIHTEILEGLGLNSKAPMTETQSKVMNGVKLEGRAYLETRLKKTIVDLFFDLIQISGIFLVPVGELECFGVQRSNKKHGPVWMGWILQDFENNVNWVAVKDFLQQLVKASAPSPPTRKLAHQYIESPKTLGMRAFNQAQAQAQAQVQVQSRPSCMKIFCFLISVICLALALR